MFVAYKILAVKRARPLYYAGTRDVFPENRGPLLFGRNSVAILFYPWLCLCPVFLGCICGLLPHLDFLASLSYFRASDTGRQKLFSNVKV